MVFYINFFPELGQNVDETLMKMKQFNQPIIEQLEKNGYSSIFLATTKEASRTEKVDFDMPFPRYVLPRMDVVTNDEIVKTVKDNLEVTK